MFGIKERRRERVRARPVPPEWRRIVDTNVPYSRTLMAAERDELLACVQVLLDEKDFVGAGGLEIDDTITVTIAAQAAVLLLGRDHDYYPRLRSIVVYPHSYRAPVSRMGITGQVEDGVEHRLGESWHAGTVVLSWSSVQQGAINPSDAENVVFHEFAHQLDAEQPRSAGAPDLGDRRLYAAWAEHMGDAYRELIDDLERHRRTLLSDYAATNAAEFFAVLTENFFERPNALHGRYPEIYELLASHYGQDPRGRTPR